MAKYRYPYKQPERFTSDEARANRVQSLLTRERERLEVERIPLSPANKFHYNRLYEFQRKFGDELEARRREFNRVKSQLTGRDPSDLLAKVLSAKSRFFQLKKQQDVLLQRAASEKRANVVQPSGGDRRRYAPYVISPRTRFGTEAYIKHWTGPSSVVRRSFKNPTLVIPCIQRVVRREVMFAFKHAGRGYRKPHKFNPLSLIGC